VLLCQSDLGKISQNHDKLSHNFGPMHTTFGEYVLSHWIHLCSAHFKGALECCHGNQILKKISNNSTLYIKIHSLQLHYYCFKKTAKNLYKNLSVYNKV